MRTKLFLIVSVLAAALVLSACGPAAPAAEARTLAVDGSGTVYLSPDLAYVYVGVHTEDPDVAQAVDSNNAQAQALVEALRAMGVADADIQTSNFSVYSSQYYSPDGLPGGTTYMVDNAVYITVRDLTTLGSLLETAVGAGANNINSIQFDVADKSAGLTEARQKAMAAAEALAEELADTAGLSLGEIQSISYSEYSPTPFYFGAGAGGGGEAPSAAVPIQPGQIQISVTVNVTYAIE
jgi:uncharacterized protein YggE